MSDYTELKARASAAFGFDDVPLAPDVILALIAENERLSTSGLGVKLEVFEIVCSERDQLKDEIEGLSHWRDLALQFDNHRMAALWHLKRLVVDPQSNSVAELFLSEPPLSAHEVVAERDQLKAENEALRKDADKWKSVKHAGDQLLADEGGAAIWSACSRVLISVASELNSGRSAVTEEGVTIGDREIGDWRVTVE